MTDDGLMPSSLSIKSQLESCLVESVMLGDLLITPSVLRDVLWVMGAYMQETLCEIVCTVT